MLEAILNNYDRKIYLWKCFFPSFVYIKLLLCEVEFFPLINKLTIIVFFNCERKLSIKTNYPTCFGLPNFKK